MPEPPTPMVNWKPRFLRPCKSSLNRKAGVSNEMHAKRDVTYRSACAISEVIRARIIFLNNTGIELSMRSATSVGGPPSQYIPTREAE